MYTPEEYETYLKVKHELYLEDARNFVADALAYQRDCYPEDIDDEEIEQFDLEELVALYEDRQSCDVAYNDTWQTVVEYYMEDYMREEA